MFQDWILEHVLIRKTYGFEEKKYYWNVKKEPLNAMENKNISEQVAISTD